MVAMREHLDALFKAAAKIDLADKSPRPDPDSALAIKVVGKCPDELCKLYVAIAQYQAHVKKLHDHISPHMVEIIGHPRRKPTKEHIKAIRQYRQYVLAKRRAALFLHVLQQEIEDAFPEIAINIARDGVVAVLCSDWKVALFHSNQPDRTVTISLVL
jgi:hypothetical protein